MSDHTLYLYGEIGDFGITADLFRQQLLAIPSNVDQITVRINSPGGSVFDGISIGNLLKAHSAKVHVIVDGLAASIASLIAMAGDEVSMAKNSLLMIHMPWTMVMGGAADLRSTADVLDKITTATLIPTYADKTGMSGDEILKMLEAETWISSDEAVAMGFADSITNDAAAMNRLSDKFRNCFKNTPEAVLKAEAIVEPPKVVESQEDAKEELGDAGLFEARLKLLSM